MSAAEGPRFAEAVAEMVERVKKLGPSPVRQRKEQLKLAA